MPPLPFPLMPLPQLRRRRLLEAIRAAGYDLRASVNGPAPRLIVTGPTSQLTPVQRQRLAAAQAELLEDVQTQEAVQAELMRLIAGLERIEPQSRFPYYRQILDRMQEARGRGVLSAAQATYVWRQLDGYTRSFPWPVPPPPAGSYADWRAWPTPGEEQVVEHVKRHARLEARAPGLRDDAAAAEGEHAPRQRKPRKARSSASSAPQAFGFAAAAELEPACPLATDADGERVAIVPSERDVPATRDKGPAAVLVFYTVEELAAMRGLTPDELRTIHRVKKAFDGQVKPGR